MLFYVEARFRFLSSLLRSSASTAGIFATEWWQVAWKTLLTAPPNLTLSESSEKHSVSYLIISSAWRLRFILCFGHISYIINPPPEMYLLQEHIISKYSFVFKGLNAKYTCRGTMYLRTKIGGRISFCNPRTRYFLPVYCSHFALLGAFQLPSEVNKLMLRFLF